MKKNITLLIGILLTTSYYCYSQALDYAQVECLYSYKMLGDRSRPNLKMNDEVLLLIGSKYTYYFSYMNHIADSLMKVNPAEFLPARTGNTVNAPRSKASLNFFNWAHYLTNRASGEVWCMDAPIFKEMFFCYTEVPEKPTWKMSSDTCSVAGYRCQKATTRYGGRDWTVWFSPEIALSEGPWKLRGLPGLILKAETADGEFALTCISLTRSTNRPIIKDEQSDCRTVSKKELFKIKKEVAKDPFPGTAMFNGKEIKTTVDYNFIEILER